VAADVRLGFEELLGRVHADDRSQVRQAFGQALRIRDEFETGFRLVGTEGQHTRILCVGRPHTSALDPSRHALSGVFQPTADAATDGGAAEPRRLGAMVERLERLHDLELRTIASRLLSEIAPRLDGLRQRIGALAGQRDLPEDVRMELAAVSSDSEAWRNELRAVLFEMLPPAVAELGFAGAIERYANEQTSASGIELALALPAEPLPLPTDTLEALYQTARAGIDNVVRHSGARHARVSVECDARQVVLTIEDDGTGIRQTDLMKEGALGLWAESERLASAGGDLRVNGRPGRGTVMEARVPVRGVIRRETTTLRVA
jgi:signal transduction histidine kinase